MEMPFRFERDEAATESVDGRDIDTVRETDEPTRSVRVREGHTRPRLLTATDLLRFVLA